MIIYTSVLRKHDSLPLCITNEFEKSYENTVQQSKSVIKLLTKKNIEHSNKICIQGENFTLQ